MGEIVATLRDQLECSAEGAERFRYRRGKFVRRVAERDG